MSAGVRLAMVPERCELALWGTAPPLAPPPTVRWCPIYACFTPVLCDRIEFPRALLVVIALSSAHSAGPVYS